MYRYFYPVFLTSTFICSFFQISAQTGPAGVGTTDGSSSLELWINPDIGVTTTGALIDNISDQSGNGLSVSSSGTNRPDLVSASLNGYNYVSFERANFEKLDLSANIAAIGSGGNRTLIYVYRFNQNNSELHAFGTSSTTFVDYGNSTVDDRIRVRNGATDQLSAVNTASQSTWHISVVSYDGTNTTVWNDNTQIVNVANNAFGWDIDANFDIGGANVSSSSFNGDIAEVIVLSHAVNTTERIILENYLAAKYGLTLASTDTYDEDDVADGNYDHQVAGIGRVSASDMQTNAKGPGMVRILNATNLNDDEFLIWGHDNAQLNTPNTVDVPGGVQARLARVWRVSEHNSAGADVDVGSIDMQWDLTGMGSVTVSDLRLLVDTDDDGTFADETPISGATSLGGNIYGFSGVSAIIDDSRFTLATISTTQTPLPVELSAFTAKRINERQIQLDWSTATEVNSDYFIVQRSSDLKTWEDITQVKSVGFSTNTQYYNVLDNSAPKGHVYYRLKQVDLDAKSHLSDVVYVNNSVSEKASISVIPNPNNGSFILRSSGNSGRYRIKNNLGQIVLSAEIKNSDQFIRLPHVSPGVYLIEWHNNEGVSYERFMVK